MPQGTLQQLQNNAQTARANLLRAPQAEPQQLRDPLTTMLATAAVRREYRNNPDAFRTAEQLQARYNQLKRAYRSAATPYVVGKFQSNMQRILGADQNGQTLEQVFHRALVGSENIYDREHLDPALNPTAREQIEALQKRLKNGKLSQKDQKIQALSQILAAREVLGIRAGVKGGDPQLDQRLTPEVFQKAQEFEGALRNMSDRELDSLNAKALAGHGGNLTKEYYEIRRKAISRMDPIPENLPKKLWPSAKNHIEAMQEQLKLVEDPEEKVRCMARILAARELVSAKRGGIFGGDEALNKRFDPQKLEARAAIIDQNIRFMYTQDQYKLFNLAQAGHGGAMMEAYKKENVYTNHMTSVHLTAKTGELDVATAMAIREGYQKDSHAEVNDAALQKLVEKIRQEPGYEEFQSHPQIQTAMKQGKLNEVTKAFQQLVAENIEKGLHEEPQPEQIELLDDRVPQHAPKVENDLGPILK